MHFYHIKDLIQLQDITVNNCHLLKDNILIVRPINNFPCPYYPDQTFVICNDNHQKLHQVRYLHYLYRETFLFITIPPLFFIKLTQSLGYR